MIHLYFFNENDQKHHWYGWKGKCKWNFHSTVSQQHNFKHGQGQRNVDGTHGVKYAIVQFYIKVQSLKPKCTNGCYCQKKQSKKPQPL